MKVAGGLVLIVACLAGCGGGGGAALEPITETGTVSVPHRPIIVSKLPSGWSVSEVTIDEPDRMPNMMQTLYLAPGSTAEDGPALAVGVNGAEYGYTLCSGGTGAVSGASGAMASALMQKSGDLIDVSGPIDGSDDGNYGFVIGRDLTEDQVLSAARAATFVHGQDATVPQKALPSDFFKLASAPVVPNQEFGEVLRLTNADGTQSVSVGAYDGNAAADQVTDFWNTTVATKPCGEGNAPQRTGRIGSTSYRVTGHTTAAITGAIESHLVATDQAGLEAFQKKTADLPASALLTGCSTPGGSVFVEGHQDTVRWVLAMPKQPSQSGMSCQIFIVDGHPEGMMAGGGGPAFATNGSEGITVLGGGSAGLTVGTANVTGGTVPKAATRVTITDGAGRTTDAVLVDGGNDPNVRYFGGMILPSSIGNNGLTITVVAYDATGAEIARYSNG